MCREPPPGHVFDPRKVAEAVRRLCHRKTTPLRPIFSRSLRNPWRDFGGNVQGLAFSGLNPTCQVSSKSIQVSQIYYRKRRSRSLQ